MKRSKTIALNQNDKRGGAATNGGVLFNMPSLKEFMKKFAMPEER